MQLTTKAGASAGTRATDATAASEGAQARAEGYERPPVSSTHALGEEHNGTAGRLNKKTVRRVLLGLLALLLVFSTVSMVFAMRFYDGYFARYDAPKYSGYLQYRDVAKEYPRTAVKFKSGQNTLTGYLYGAGNRKGLVVIAPGRREGTETFLPETVYFVDQGWRVFSFDYTGSFESEGANMVGLPQPLTDLRAALAYIASSATLKDLPIMLYGHSWGGYAVAAMLSYDHDIAAVASIAGFNSPMGLLAEYTKGQMGLLGHIVYPFAWVYQAVRFGSKAWVSAVDGINSTDTPVMIIHGTADEENPYNGPSIIAQRGNITNPNVVYKTCSEANRNGHSSLYESAATVAYINKLNQEYQALSDRYNGNIPDSVRAQCYAGVNRFKTSERDTAFMNEINRFFERSLGGSGG